MKKLGVVSLVSFLLFTFCTAAVAKKKEYDETKPVTGFPISYTKVVPGAEQFENAGYFSLLASDGIRKV
jgi:hypothetical protein